MTENHLLILKGIRAYAAKQQLDWQWFTIGDEKRDERRQLANLLPAPDGIIGFNHQEWFSFARTRNIPLISFTGPFPTPAKPEIAIRIDETIIPELAARFALEQGFKHVASIDDLRLVHTQRTRAFLEAASALGLKAHKYDPTLALAAKSKDRIRKCVEWIRQQPGPLFIFMHQDRAAAWFLNQASSVGLQIPKECSVLGVDNLADFCEAQNPRLSSIAHSEYHRGFIAAEQMHNLLQGLPIQKRVISVPPLRVVERDSTAKVKASDPLVAKAQHLLRPQRRSGPLSIQEVVDTLGVSQSTLHRHFIETLGVSAKTIQLRLRLEWAEQLLLESQKSVQDIARLCGFGSRIPFTRAFKQRCGHSPQEFRSLAGYAKKESKQS